MNKSFNQWVEDTYFKEFQPDNDRLSDMEKGWDACKDKVLELLKKSQTSKQDGGVFDIDVIKEIEEKL